MGFLGCRAVFYVDKKQKNPAIFWCFHKKRKEKRRRKRKEKKEKRRKKIREKEKKERKRKEKNGEKLDKGF